MEKVPKNYTHVLYITWRATQQLYSKISNPSSSSCWDQRDSNSFILSWTERPSFKLCAPNTKKPKRIKRLKNSSYVKIVNVFKVKGRTHILHMLLPLISQLRSDAWGTISSSGKRNCSCLSQCPLGKQDSEKRCEVNKANRLLMASNLLYKKANKPHQHFFLSDLKPL